MLLTKAGVTRPCKVAKSACYHIAADCQTMQQQSVRGQPVSMTTWSRSKRVTCLMTVPVVLRSLDICGIHGTNEPITNTIQFPIKMSWLADAIWVSELTWYHSSKRYKSEDHSFSSRGEAVVRGELVLRWKAILHPMRILARSKQRGVFVSHYGTEKEETREAG